MDIRYAWRMLAKNRGFTAIAVLILALGIGANSTFLSWISATLLDPIPGVAHFTDLVSIMRGQRVGNPVPPFSYPDYIDFREKSRSFAGILAYHEDAISLTGAAIPERVYGTVVSANYFDVLGIQPSLGRGFLPEEETRPDGAPIVVISHDLWRTRFAGDRSVLGRTIDINRSRYTIVGVAPPRFQGCRTGLRSDVWIPLTMDHAVFGGTRLSQRDTSWLQLLGKLSPGISGTQAEQELNAIMRHIVELFPDEHRGANEISLDPLWRSPFGANAALYSTLPILLGVSGVVLLLACANVANLLLGRTVARRREIAIRLSMGASRGRLVRQLLIESLMLSLAGGAVAVTLTIWTAQTLANFIPSTNMPIVLNGRMDGKVLFATLLMSVVVSAIFGILPALRSSGIDPVPVLKEESGSVSGSLYKARLSRSLVVVQIAFSFMLLVCAGLFVRSLQKMQQVDPGFDPNHVLLASYELGPMGYSAEDGLTFDQQLLDKLEAVPGIESAALSDWVPLSLTKRTEGFSPEGYEPRLHETMDIRRAIVSPNYFRTMRIPIVHGREFTKQDTDKSQRVVTVNEEFAARYWPNLDPVGKRLLTRGQWFTVVGVVANSRCHRLSETPEPVFYLPLFQVYRQDTIIHARVVGEPQAFASAIRQTVHGINPDLPLFNVVSLRESTRLATIFERIAVTFVGAFGLLALVLAAVGIYGVVSYATRQRTREIGIRLAIGAQQKDVFQLVLGQGLQLTVIGLVVGCGASIAATRLLRTLLFGVTETDALTFATVALVLALVTGVACFVPAWRACHLEPTLALREQ